MAETGFVTEKTAMTEEEKKSLWQVIIEAIRNLFSKGNIIQQKVEQKLNELDAAMTQAIENDEITQEQLESIQDAVEELAKKTEELTKNMDGSIKPFTSEDVEKTFDEFINKADGVINARKTVAGIDLEGQVAKTLSLRTKNDPELSKTLFGTDNRESIEQFLKGEFAEDFKKNARVFESKKLQKNQLLLEYKGQVFLVTGEFKKNDLGAVTMDVSLSRSPFTIDAITKETDTFEQIKTQTPRATVVRQLCHKNGYEYAMNISDKEQFIGTYAGKTVTIDNGIECTLDRETGNFHVRDTNTGKMLVVKSENDKVSIVEYAASENINDTSKENVNLGCWETTENGVEANFMLPPLKASVNLLLFNKAMSDYLALTHGIDKDMQTDTFSQNAEIQWSMVVSDEGRQKVDALYEKFKDSANFDDYTVEKHEGKNGTVYLAVSDGENKMALVFNESGNPTAVNFREGEYGRYATVFDIQKNTANEYFRNYRVSDATSKSFGQLFAVMENTLNEAGVVNNVEVRKDDIEKNSKDKSGERKGEER